MKDSGKEAVAAREQLIVDGISALLSGVEAQDPTVRDFIERTTDAAEEMVGPDDVFPADNVVSLMLDAVGYDPRKRVEVERKALSHAKGVLVGIKSSPDRDSKLQSINRRLDHITPVPIKPR